MENERLQQRLRDAKATEAELDRLEAQQQAIPSHLLLQQPPYAGNPHVRGNTIPPSQSFAWTLNSAASTSSRNFDSRQFYPSLPDLSPMGGAGGSSLAVGSSSPSVGDQVDPSSDQTLPRKKVTLRFSASRSSGSDASAAEQEDIRPGALLLHDLRQNRLTRVAEGKMFSWLGCLRVLTYLLGSTRAEDVVQRVWLALGEVCAQGS